MKKHMYIVMLLCMVIVTAIPAVVPYFEYVEEPVNPRLMGMGGVGTALFSGGYAYYNPAGAAFADNSFISFDFGRQWGDLSRGSVESAWIFDRWFIGGTMIGRTVEYPLSDVTGILPGKGSQQETQISLFTGWKKNRYAIGIAGNGLPHFIAGENAFAFSLSGGISAIILPERLTVGAAVLHAGRLHRGFYEHEFSSYTDSMATMIRAGGAYRDTVFESVPFTVSFDGVYLRSEHEYEFPIGVEIRPVAPLAVRFGKRFNHLTDVFSFGTGISWENVVFDAAFVITSLDDGPNEMKWLMGITYALPNKKKKSKKNSIQDDSVLVTPLPEKSDGKEIPVKEPVMEKPAVDTTRVDSVTSVDTLQKSERNEPDTIESDTGAIQQTPPSETDTIAVSAEENDNVVPDIMQVKTDSLLVNSDSTAIQDTTLQNVEIRDDTSSISDSTVTPVNGKEEVPEPTNQEKKSKPE